MTIPKASKFPPTLCDVVQSCEKIVNEIAELPERLGSKKMAGVRWTIRDLDHVNKLKIFAGKPQVLHRCGIGYGIIVSQMSVDMGNVHRGPVRLLLRDRST